MLFQRSTTRSILLLALPCLSLVLVPGTAGAEHLLSQEHFARVAQEFSGEMAREFTGRIVEYHRIQGSPMMAEAARKVVLHELSRLKIPARIESFPSDGTIRYEGHVSPIGWTMRGGQLWVEEAPGQKTPLRLCRYSDVPMCVSTYSKGGNFRGELIDVGRGTTEEDYLDAPGRPKNVRGKVVLAYGYAARVMRQAVLVHGAAGIVIYPPPLERAEHPDLIRYNGLWPEAQEVPKMSGGFQISQNQYVHLRQLMAKGRVVVRGEIDAALGPGELTLVHAYIKGTKEPEREVLLTAHLDHPKWSANDNASGSGAMLEMVRTLATLIQRKELPPPKRTLHFLWVPEFSGTYAYVHKHRDAIRSCLQAEKTGQRGCIVANLNLDMVGEDPKKTNSRFYMTRTPDSVPSILDGVLGEFLRQTREARLVSPTGLRQAFLAEMIPYAPGSDHDIFLSLGIPASMFGHAPDWTHHSSADTLDKTDPSEFLRVGVLASAAAYYLAIATVEDAPRLLPLAVSSRATVLSERLGQVQAAIGAGARETIWPEVASRLSSRLSADLGLLVRGNDKGYDKKNFPEALEDLLRGSSSPGSHGPMGLSAAQPLPESVFEKLPESEKKTYEDAQARLLRAGPGWAQPPDPEVLRFEIFNHLNGRRSPKEIATAVSAEFLWPIDEAFVELCLRIVHRQGILRK